MPMRSSSLANNPLAITRELDGRYDVVLQVRDNLDLIEQVAGIDFATILAELESAQDFTGITVVQGEIVAWDAVNKILTVPKGDKGDKGDTGLTGPQGTQGVQGPQGIKGDTGLKGDTGSQGPKGFTGDTGIQGIQGIQGEVGPQGIQGIHGIQGEVGNGINGISKTATVGNVDTYTIVMDDLTEYTFDVTNGTTIDHVSKTAGTGLSGSTDTYTIWLDVGETISVGTFNVYNGADGLGVGDMLKSTYDTNNSGVVDNAEKVNGLTVKTAVPAGAVFTDTVYDDTVVQVHISDNAKHFTQSEISITESQISDLRNYELANATILKESDISITLQPYNVNTVIDSSYVHTDNNFTSLLKTKLDNIAENAEANVSSDWNAISGDAQILNKPTTISGYGITDAYTKTEINSSLALKVDKVAGKGLSTEDYSTAEKTKLAGIASSANNYSLPVATNTILGGVKAGVNVSIDANGVISANDSSVSWSEITSKPTTVAGYGITNAYTKTEIDAMVGNINSALDTINGQVI